MVELNDIRFRYPSERFELSIPELHFQDGDSTAVVGPSGCGKSTLLRLVSGILTPQQGTLGVLGESIESWPESRRRAFRLQNIGLVFQNFELLNYLTARENILSPLRLSKDLRDTSGNLESLAERTGITHLLDAPPTRLSQGEQQRVAICRALITKPSLILADEPTGSLDPDNQANIVQLLLEASQEHKSTLIMVTHNHELLSSFPRTVNLPEVRRS